MCDILLFLNVLINIESCTDAPTKGHDEAATTDESLINVETAVCTITHHVSIYVRRLILTNFEKNCLH